MMAEHHYKLTPSDMAMILTGIVEGCRQRDGQLTDAMVRVSAADAAWMDTTARFLFLLDGHQEAIRQLITGQRRRAG
jgi:hypothetical protein